MKRLKGRNLGTPQATSTSETGQASSIPARPACERRKRRALQDGPARILFSLMSAEPHVGRRATARIQSRSLWDGRVFVRGFLTRATELDAGSAATGTTGS